MATNIFKSANLIQIKTDTNLSRCYSINSGYKFAPKQSYLTTNSDSILFTIGGESVEIVCANGITLGAVATVYTTITEAYPALISYLA